MIFNDADSVYAYLDRYLNFERKVKATEYRLDRMESLQRLFDYPDRAYRVVHVAGSKGKGSTATMLASIMKAAGKRVGLYTSPHLLSFTERIAIDGEPVTNDILLDCAEELSSVMENRTEDDFPGGESPTYFELLTMLGFLCFRKAGCSDAVIEVGLGGRLDSTNVVMPIACIITPIELEHTELLGDSIPKIAYEKAGIIKPGVPVFTSATRPDALDVFRKRALECGSPLMILDEVATLHDCLISPEGSVATVHWKEGSTRTLFDHPLRLHSPMIGHVQARNAATVAIVAKALGYDEESIDRGIGSARLRARFEIIPGNPVIILDGAHTEDSVRACSDDFKFLFPGAGILLFGCAKGKPARPMARVLRSVFSEVFITKPGTFKESDTVEIEEAFVAEGFSVKRIDNTEDALEAALSHASAERLPLLVTGSFYLCAAVAGRLSR